MLAKRSTSSRSAWTTPAWCTMVEPACTSWCLVPGAPGAWCTVVVPSPAPGRFQVNKCGGGSRQAILSARPGWVWWRRGGRAAAAGWLGLAARSSGGGEGEWPLDYTLEGFPGKSNYATDY